MVTLSAPGATEGVNTGATFSVQSYIGPSLTCAQGGTSNITFTGIAGPLDTATTFAAIVFTPATFAASTVVLSNSNSAGPANGWQLQFASTGAPQIGLTFGVLASGPVCSANTPYFILASGSTSPARQNFVITNLQTGRITFATTTTAITAQTAPAGGVTIFNYDTASAAWGGQVACVAWLGGSQVLDKQTILQWAANPWDFWFPTNNINLILSSLQGSQGTLPSGAQWYDLPIQIPSDRGYGFNRSYDQAPTPSRLLAGLKPFKQDDWQVPFPAFDERRGQWNRSADQGSTQRLATIKAPITGPTQDLPIPPFRPQVSADLGSTQRLATIQAPITGPTQDLPIPPFRPQVSSDLGSTQRLATIQPPNPRFDWQLPQQPFRPQFSFDQGNASFLTVTVTLPRNQYDWPLPSPAVWQRYGLIYNKAQQAGNQPFAQTEWPLPIPPFRPDFTFMPSAPLWLSPVVLPRNQYDWPLPIPFSRLDQNYAQWFNPIRMLTGNKPFALTEWPNPVPPFRPDATFLSVSPVWLTTATLPLNQYDWPLPGRPSTRLYGIQYAANITVPGQPIGMQIYDLPIPPRRPDANFTYFTPPGLIPLPPPPFHQTDWPLPIQPFRPQFSSDLAAMTLLSQVFMNLPPEWELPRQQPYRDYSYVQGLDLGLMTVVAPFPRNQYDWPLPIPRFRIDQTSTLNYNPTQMLTGTKPFAQTDWPLPILNPYGNVTIYTITAPNNPNIYPPPPPSTVKIEWLIRARRRGRR